MTPSKAEDWDGTQTCLMRLESDHHITIINNITIIIIVLVISLLDVSDHNLVNIIQGNFPKLF